jgi:hypothetical protein
MPKNTVTCPYCGGVISAPRHITLDDAYRQHIATCPAPKSTRDG